MHRSSVALFLSAALVLGALGACSTPFPAYQGPVGFFVDHQDAEPPPAVPPDVTDHGTNTAGASTGATTTGATPLANGAPVTTTGAAPTDTADDPEELPEPRTIREAIEQGRPYLKIRIRAEEAHQSGLDKDSHAVTVRSVLGFETAALHGFSALVEVENVSRLGPKTYNDTYNGKTDRPVIADPTDTEVNQAYLQYAYEASTLRGGRQRITLDNQRFIGNVGWRQNEQTFDAVTAKSKAGPVDLYLGWLDNANRIFGDDSPMGDARMNSWVVHAKADVLEKSSFTGYWYYLDFERSSGLTMVSTSTLGGRFVGAFGGEDMPEIDVLAEYATQDDIGDNPSRVQADYSHFKVSGDAGPVTLGVGQETLHGSKSNSGAFSTPLATLHAFNGWADKFLNTPATGLQDTYVSVGGKLMGTKLQAVYHDFRSDASSMHYGQEIDLAAIRPIDENSTWGAKYANYDADDFATDTQKFWLWYETRF